MAVAFTSIDDTQNPSVASNGSITFPSESTASPGWFLITSGIGNATNCQMSGATVGGTPASLIGIKVMPDGVSHCEVWGLWCPAPLTAVAVVITYATAAGAGAVPFLTLATGTDINSIGNVAVANSTSASATASITCSATGSVPFGGVFGFGSTFAAGTNTTLIVANNDGAGDFAATLRNNQATTLGNPFAVTATQTSGQWAMVVVEIKPAGVALTPSLPSVSEAFSRPPQPTRQHDAQWSSSQSMDIPVIAPPGPYYEAPQPARESRVLRHEGIFQPVQPLAAPLSGVTFVGHAGGTTSGTLPRFLPGDIAIVWAFRDGSATAPSLPAGWTGITTVAGTTCSARIGFRILQAGDTTIGTWTSATETIVQIYRGQLAAYGVSENPAAATANGVSSTVSYPALTLAHGNGASWVIGFAGHRSIDTTLETPPTGMIARHDELDATAEAAGHDTKGGVSSWSLQTVAVGGTSSGWVGATVEIAAAVSVTVASEAGNAAVGRALRSEGIFQPVQPLGAIASLPVSSFGDAPAYYQSRETNPRVAQSASAEALRAPVIPAPTPFGDAPQPQTTRRRNDRVTDHHDGSALPAPALFVSRYPIVKSGRKMFDQQGNPFRIKGRTAWGIVSLTPALRAAFLDDTLSHGFNAIECQLTTHLPEIRNIPFDGAGNLPFLKRLDGTSWTGSLTYGTIANEAPDFSTPNSAYWSFVDGLVADCLSRNILLMGFPLYLGGPGQGDGWVDEMTANGDPKTQGFGAFVAARYSTQPHLVWMTAGDTAAGLQEESNLIIGITSVTTLSTDFSSERAGGSISTDGTGILGPSTTLNGAYDWATVIQQCQRAYSFSTRTIPSYMVEEPYDQEGTDGNSINPTFATQPVRRFEWWGWLNTIGGYIAGNGYVWRFKLTGTPPAEDDYRNHLNTQNTQDLGRLNAFMELWSNTNDLVPGGLGGMRTLVVSGAGTIDTGNFVCAAQTTNGTLMIGYSPPGGSGTFSLDLRSMSGAGSGIRARWWDPTAAAFTTNGSAAGTFTLSNTAASQSFTTPGTNSAGDSDWVLVLDAQAAQAGVEVPEQISRSQRASRAPFRIQSLEVLPALAAPPAPSAWGYEPGAGGTRAKAAPKLSAGGDAGATAPGPIDWDPIVSIPVVRQAKLAPPSSPADPMPPPPFPPIAWVLDPSAPVRVYRAEHRTGNQLVIPPPPFPPTGFEVGAAIARALARLQSDQPIALPGAGVADWTPDVYGDLARAPRARFSPDQERFPGLAVVTLPAWGFEPEPPRTRSPAADRRLVNGEPLRSPVSVVLVAWGFEPPAAPARGPRLDRRGVAGEPMPGPVLAALTAWFDVSVPAARGPSARIWTPGEPLPAAGPADWVDTAAPAPARGAPRGRAPAGGDPLPLLVLTPWGWESLGAARGRGARIDARSAETSPPLIVSAPAGFDPTAPPLRAPARRRETWAEGLPVVFIPPPPAPWGYEPSSPMTRWVSSARFPLGGDGTTLVVVVLRPAVRARLGAGPTAATPAFRGPTRGEAE